MPEWIKSVTLLMHNYGIDGFLADEMHIETYPHARTVFDENGNVLEEISFSREGGIESRYKHTFDDQRFLVEECYYSAEELTDRRTFERMADGKISRELKHYLDGSFDTITYVYDGQGHLIEKVTTDEEGVVESRTVFEYVDLRLSAEKEMDGRGDVISEKKYLLDDHGHLAEFTEWDRENNRHNRTVDEYDEQGVRVRSSRYIDGKLRERIGYTQDEKGRVARMTEENDRGGSTYQFEYDDSGNVLLQVETDGQGTVISKMERTYDAMGRIQENRVFIDGQGRRMSQYYKVEYVYELDEQATE